MVAVSSVRRDLGGSAHVGVAISSGPDWPPNPIAERKGGHGLLIVTSLWPSYSVTPKTAREAKISWRRSGGGGVFEGGCFRVRGHRLV
jgi:hypothetical protein